eukprot:GFYU01002644.1.p1 GENE.GFYU01002644.1~~GFYU01002644.1.p1  ORF type:complete len:612 (-),score=213.94 GFYU01002644.1:24-1859(-)
MGSSRITFRSSVALMMCVALVATASVSAQPHNEEQLPECRVDRVLVVGIDGLSSHILKSPEFAEQTPNLRAFCDKGFCATARSVVPSTSMPNWFAHLASQSPELSGMTAFNGNNGLKPVDGGHKSLFRAVRDHNDQATTAAFVQWGPLRETFKDDVHFSWTPYNDCESQGKERQFEDAQHVFNARRVSALNQLIAGVVEERHNMTKVRNMFEEYKTLKNKDTMYKSKLWKDMADPLVKSTLTCFEKNDADTVKSAAEYKTVGWKVPDLSFVYIGQVDETGHTHGWFGPEYKQAIARADEALNTLVLRYAEYDKRDDAHTLIAVVADHGGSGTSHRNSHHEWVMDVPWMFSGPCVTPQKINDPKYPISTLDTSTTLFHLLGAKPDQMPSQWYGRVIAQVSEGLKVKPSPVVKDMWNHELYQPVAKPHEKSSDKLFDYSPPNLCMNRCSGHGQCIDATCTCDKGWGNADCSVRLEEVESASWVANVVPTPELREQREKKAVESTKDKDSKKDKEIKKDKENDDRDESTERPKEPQFDDKYVQEEFSQKNLAKAAGHAGSTPPPPTAASLRSHPKSHSDGARANVKGAAFPSDFSEALERMVTNDLLHRNSRAQ